jgi:GDP-L-fucose synthase
MGEGTMLTCESEPTNDPHTKAKIVSIKTCKRYHIENSHVIPSLIRHFHTAKTSGAPEVAIWSTGTPRREFLYVDDMAAANVFVMNLPLQGYQAHTSPMQSHLNVGFGSDVTIAELAHSVGQAVGYGGNVTFDPSRPEGAPRKWMDSSRLNALGWQAQVDLAAGLRSAYADFVQSHPV